MIAPVRHSASTPRRRRAGIAVYALALLARVAAAAPVATTAGGEVATGLVRLDGHAVGSYREETRAVEDGIETRSSLAIRLDRMATVVELAAESTAIESADGALLRLVATTRVSRQTTSIEVAIDGDRLRVTRHSGGDRAAATREEIALDGALLGPAAIRRRTAERLLVPGDRVEFATFVPDLGGVFTFARELAAIEPAGARRVVETLAGLPLTRELWIDATGASLRERETSPFGPLELVPADPATIAAELAAAVPQEIYARTVARANVRLPSPRAIARTTLRLTLIDAERGFPELAGPQQRVTETRTAERLLEVVSPPVPAGARRFASAEEAPADVARWLAPNSVLESAHPAVVALAREIVGDESDGGRAAELLAEGVARRLRFDLGIVFAPASELARDRRGTCAGYAVLLAALARASGLPSRVAIGFVYVGGVWAGHAWTEIWLAGDWIPFDAALPSPAGAADAARFAFAREDFAAGMGTAILGGLQLFGNLEVAVERFTLDGREIVVPADEPAVRTTASSWSSFGLGLRLEAPAGFAVGETDRLWPETTLVALTAGPHERIVLEELALGAGDPPALLAASVGDRGAAVVAGRVVDRPAAIARGERWAAAAWSDGSTLLRLTASGPQAARRLDQALAGLTRTGARP